MSNKMIQTSLKIFYYLKRVGIKGLYGRIRRSLGPKDVSYTDWVKKYGISERKKTWNVKKIRETESNIDILVLDVLPENSKMYESFKNQILPARGWYTDLNDVSSEYVMLVSSVIELEQDAIWAFHQAIIKNQKPDLLYSDHDELYAEPMFKPDFNYDLLLSYNYMGSVIVVRRECLEFIWKKQTDKKLSAYDIILRTVEAGCRVHHVPTVLYHSMKKRHEATQADRSSVGSHLERMGYNVNIHDGKINGTYHVEYLMESEPLVSIIIPNKDHVSDLQKCLDSIVNTQTYRNYEILIVENNSHEKATFEYYNGLLKKHDNIKILYWKDIFNYSKINNWAAKRASGDYYLFLNNDIEFISKNAIREMLGICTRKDVGIVGAKLYYSDETIQHAGVIVGYGGIAGHAFLGCPGADTGYMNRLECCQNYSAVTAACMMVKKEAFRSVKGFNKNLQVAFNDVDFCLKVLKSGYCIVYTPYAEAYHYESKTRGVEDNYKKIKRFNQEVDLFRSRWMDFIEHGDPAYNPNLSLYKWDFSLKE